MDENPNSPDAGQTPLRPEASPLDAANEPNISEAPPHHPAGGPNEFQADQPLQQGPERASDPVNDPPDEPVNGEELR
jgi:hypothetical protein